MEMLGGQGDTGRRDCLGREESIAEHYLGVAVDWADVVTDCHKHQLAFGLDGAPQCACPSCPPSQMLKLISSLVMELIGGGEESGKRFEIEGGTSG